MAFNVVGLKFSSDAIRPISSKAMDIHHGKLYTGYVNKRNEIDESLKTADKTKAVASYSVYRELKLEETFNANGQILHELYFATLTPTPKQPSDELEFVKKVKEDFGSWDAFIEDVVACAMSARGWAITAYDFRDGKIRNFLADAHNQGGVWETWPVWTIDVYEHAYFIDFGSDRKSYILEIIKYADWEEINKRFLKAKAIEEILKK
ncbi:MAG: Fe-Mn family superoxide dismutase [Brevinematia bacterium]